MQGGQTREMASQILAAKVIHHLVVPGFAAAPPGKLPSHHDFLQLWHHQHCQIRGFKGIPSNCCTIDFSTKKTRCREVGGVSPGKGAGKQEALASWQRWSTTGKWLAFPRKTVTLAVQHSQKLLSKSRQILTKKMKNSVNQAVISSLTTQSFNLAPSDYI